MFRGRDDARLPVVSWLLLAVLFLPLSRRLVGVPGFHAALALTLFGVALQWLDSRSRRFELRVGPAGYLLYRYRIGIVLTGVHRRSLEHEVVVHDDWTSDERLGFTFGLAPGLVPLRGRREPKDLSFGPEGEGADVDALLEEIRCAAEHYRRQVSQGDIGRETRRGSGDVALLWDRVDVDSVQRGPWGRVRSMRLARGAQLGGLRLPPGTLVELRLADGWQAPSSPDRVTSVTLGGIAVWDAMPAMLRPGARVALDDRGRIERVTEAFDEPVRIQGILADGRGELAFDERGRLTGCTLAEPRRWAQLRLPAGTRVSRYSDVSLDFTGPGIEVEDEPDVRPARAYVWLQSGTARVPLARILNDPHGRVRGRMHLTKDGDGSSGERQHWDVPVRT